MLMDNRNPVEAWQFPIGMFHVGMSFGDLWAASVMQREVAFRCGNRALRPLALLLVLAALLSALAAALFLPLAGLRRRPLALGTPVLAR